MSMMCTYLIIILSQSNTNGIVQFLTVSAVIMSHSIKLTAVMLCNHVKYVKCL